MTTAFKNRPSEQTDGRRKKDMDNEEQSEKFKKRFKMVKDREQEARLKRERREKKDKRKKDKKVEKIRKAAHSLSLGVNPDHEKVLRLAPSGELQKTSVKHAASGKEQKHASEHRESVFSTKHLGKRELSPELARISALTAGPPKSKCDCKKTWTSRAMPCPHSARSSAANLDSSCSSSKSNPPLLERADISTSPCKKQSHPPSLERADVCKLRAALKVYCDDKNVKDDTELGPPVLEPLDPVAYYYDSDGNKVWICPTCGGQDDGSPMIGCDDCDAWYHWVCVGMKSAPDENEDWYCRHCLAKRRERMRGRTKLPKRKTSS